MMGLAIGIVELIVVVLGLVVLAAVILVVHSTMRGTGRSKMNDDETRDLQELHRVLEGLEERIERLEDELTRRLGRDADEK